MVIIYTEILKKKLFSFHSFLLSESIEKNMLCNYQLIESKLHGRKHNYFTRILHYFLRITAGQKIKKSLGKKTREIKYYQIIFFREIAFFVVLNFFSRSEIDFGHF